MEKFLRWIGSGCRSIVRNQNSKGHFLSHNKNMSNSVTIDIVEQSNWDDQGKPLVKSNKVINLPSNRRLLSTSSVIGDTPDLASISVVSPIHVAKYSELPRLILSYVYMFVFGLANAFVVIVAHDRTPNRDRYLPLPDLILDNVANVTWAFHACEAIAAFLFVIFALLMCFHKHRFVILRRLFIIYGSVMLMRCPAMLLTSLSIPDQHMQCDPMLNDTVWSKLQRAGDLYLKFGMSAQGVRTCGDYMFSGHTVFITLLNFVINEYTPLLILHIISWILTLTAISFIMLGHAHYSIDILIAFFISSLYFYYYHTLANYHKPGSISPLVSQPSNWFTRFCITRRGLPSLVPFYGFLERKTGGSPVPHEFESPLTAILRVFGIVRNRIITGKSRLI